MSDKFRFRDTDTIGVADAESDSVFLEDCFIDNGVLDLLADCRDKRRIVVGRTGAGKTALLNQLRETRVNAIVVNPEGLALAYISNSNILQFVLKLGVNLDVFFRLLWRHVFTVEIIKARFEVTSSTGREPIVDWIRNQFSSKQRRHEKALKYLETWGSTFWEQTDSRVTEVTTKFESELKDSIGAAVPHFKVDMADAEKFTQEQKAQIINRATSVVNSVQIQELSYVLDLLNEVIDDPQRPYYLIVDKLDENWVEERIRFLLIRALIETARDFFKVQNAKVILCLRYDLVDRVARETRSAGYQEEKYESLFLDLKWKADQLVKLLDARINKLVRQRYTSKLVTHHDILPRTINKQDAMAYILSRTLMRPRDVIMFFNACIRQADGNIAITSEMVKTAEGEYSRSRLRSIADEWSTEYPNLIRLTDILKEKREVIRVLDITDDECLELTIDILAAPNTSPELTILALQADQNTDFGSMRRYVAAAFYRVGLAGLKITPYDPVVWSTTGRHTVSASEIGPETRIQVHPCFWRSLGTKPNQLQ